jgi:subfamily B ATP-binding cassette protein HlyB/CyaB
LDGSHTEIPDTGLLCLTLIASYYRVATDMAQLRHELALGDRLAEDDDILRAARRLGLKASAVKRKAREIEALPLPVIFRTKDGAYAVLIRNTPSGKHLVVHSGERGRGTPTEFSTDALAQIWSGDVLLVTRRMGGAGVSPTTFNFSWFLPTLWRYRKPLASVLLASLFVQLFALVTPLFFQLIVDKVLLHKAVSTLTMVVTGLIALGTFDCVLQHLRAYILAHTTSRIDVELGSRLFDHLTRVPVSYFETRPAGQIVARVRELETIRSFLTGQGLSSAIDVLFSVVFIAVLFMYSTTLSLVVVGSLFCYVAIALVLRPLLRDKIAERFQCGSASQQFLVESVIGFQTLKAAAVEPMLRSQWEDRLAAYVRTSFETVALSSLGQNAIQFVNKTSIAIVLFLGAQAVIDGQLTVGALIAFNMLMGQATQPILRLSQLWHDFQQVQISVERLGDILNCPTEGRPTGQISLPAPRGAIEICEATFRYRSDTPEVLKNVSLSIPAGQVIGIVGASGSGKSTLTKLLQRFYKPERGQILLDGIDIAQVDTAWLRRQIGVVQQEDILFNRTVHENIALANPSMPRGQVIEVARLAGADEFINKLPLGYDTMIEERGANLSGGQRQRIAIARALATRPRILILDEATSALDYESERVIRENMRRIGQGRTVIVIAHRLAAVRNCDRIIAMNDGRIVEDGTHDSLIADPTTVYGRLWRLQNETEKGASS